jgi:NCAIR mutase (PurE)-related protein
MTPDEIRIIVEALRNGVARPGDFPVGPADSPGYLEIGNARLDLDRQRRKGMPEVVYCESKLPDDLVSIMRTLYERTGLAYGTRCSPEQAAAVIEALEDSSIADYDPVSRTLRLGAPMPAFTTALTAVIVAGTSDRPVAEEACRTLETFGAPVDRIYDVGVAGLHRLLSQMERISSAAVLIVVAGMEGALPGVVGGLCSQPLVAVPTSVGYGTSMGGFTPLFAMLSSCASGMTVVNIDNGFGAAAAALSILRAIERYTRDESVERG